MNTMNTIDTLDTLATRIHLQAIVHGISTETAGDYLDLNIGRFTGLVSRNDYYDILWEITSEAAHNEAQWQQYQNFSRLVTNLVNEYYMSFIEEDDEMNALLKLVNFHDYSS